MYKNHFSAAPDSVTAFLNQWNSKDSTIELLTSGSTGQKKIIYAEKKYLEESVRMTGSFFDFSKNMVALHCLPMDFIAGKMMLLRMVAFQMKAKFCSPSDPLNFPDNLVVDFAAMTPLQYQKCLNQNETKLTQIKTVLLGGASINPALEKTIAALPHQVYHSYGMTETYSHVALRKVGIQHHFEALDGIHFSTNAHGALLIHAPRLGIETLETNDLVEFINDKQFRFIGRFDFVVNSGGIKLHPEELERKIASLLPNNNYFFAGVPEEHLGEKLVLFIESKEALKLEEINSKLSKFERPKDIIFCNTFFYTNTGKLDRIHTVKTLMD